MCHTPEPAGLRPWSDAFVTHGGSNPAQRSQPERLRGDPSAMFVLDRLPDASAVVLCTAGHHVSRGATPHYPRHPGCTHCHRAARRPSSRWCTAHASATASTSWASATSDTVRGTPDHGRYAKLGFAGWRQNWAPQSSLGATASD